MENYTTLSLETHLFFARIMREHALFLEAGFPCINQLWIKEADWFREQFETLLREIVRISNGRINNNILESKELVTDFTIPAEKRTEQLSGISIDTEISMMEQKLHSGCSLERDRNFTGMIHRINEQALRLVDELIDFKEKLLQEVSDGKLFNTNYPLLIKHTIREAKLYRDTLEGLMQDNQPSYKNLPKTESFWNQIMMEHALFIRGLLDPSEIKLIHTANEFAEEYKELLKMAGKQDCQPADALTRKSLEETLKIRDFKTTGTEGILNCEIASLILPLLADHVLREANHYIRLLECGM